MTRTARPPTAPPTIGPMLDEDFSGVVGVVEVVPMELEVVVDEMETDVVRPNVTDADDDTVESRSVQT